MISLLIAHDADIDMLADSCFELPGGEIAYIDGSTDEKIDVAEPKLQYVEGAFQEFSIIDSSASESQNILVHQDIMHL